jgi:hypothetical protein
VQYYSLLSERDVLTALRHYQNSANGTETTALALVATERLVNDAMKIKSILYCVTTDFLENYHRYLIKKKIHYQSSVVNYSLISETKSISQSHLPVSCESLVVLKAKSYFQTRSSEVHKVKNSNSYPQF